MYVYLRVSVYISMYLHRSTYRNRIHHKETLVGVRATGSKRLPWGRLDSFHRVACPVLASPCDKSRIRRVGDWLRVPNRDTELHTIMSRSLQDFESDLVCFHVNFRRLFQQLRRAICELVALIVPHAAIGVDLFKYKVFYKIHEWMNELGCCLVNTCHEWEEEKPNKAEEDYTSQQ